MRILWLDPFHGGSHAAVADGFARFSRHEVVVLPLSIAGGWRWRMRGAAVTLARQVMARWPDRLPFDLIVATDMLDLATFLGLTRRLAAHLPTAIYFHENQLTYPLPPGRSRDLAFPWVNYTGALVAHAVLFNSAFHRDALLGALPGLIGRFHDHQERDLVEYIAARSHVLPPGIDLVRLDGPTAPGSHDPPVVLWNSRWEYDKNPQAFFNALLALAERGVPFRLIVAGEHIDPNAPEFVAVRERLASQTVWWGYAPDQERYRQLLHQADIVVSTAVQEFFGISFLEALYCGCLPLAPHRLSYPELLPASAHDAHLFASQDDLVAKLGALLANPAAFRHLDVRAVAAQYDWRVLVARYDDLLERAAAAGPGLL